MRISSHQINPFGRRCVHGNAGRPSVTAACILKHVSTGQTLAGLVRISSVRREYRTVVSTIEACKAVYIFLAPVFQHGGIKCLVIDSFYRHVQLLFQSFCGKDSTFEFIHSETFVFCILGIDLRLILNHTAIGRHIGKEYQRQTSGEQTATTTQLQSIVAKYIPTETYTRRYCQ